ncbi:MAG: hypothetical protein ACLU37_07180 [Collinsella sp.]
MPGVPLHDTYHWEFGFAAGAAGVLMATTACSKFADGARCLWAPIDLTARPSTCLWHAISTRTTCRRSAAVRPIIACAACDLRG